MWCPKLTNQEDLMVFRVMGMTLPAAVQGAPLVEVLESLAGVKIVGGRLAIFLDGP